MDQREINRQIAWRLHWLELKMVDILYALIGAVSMFMSPMLCLASGTDGGTGLGPVGRVRCYLVNRGLYCATENVQRRPGPY
jgi:hypothetical protein